MPPKRPLPSLETRLFAFARVAIVLLAVGLVALLAAPHIGAVVMWAILIGFFLLFAKSSTFRWCVLGVWLGWHL
jgi:hypothetical protein